MSDPQLNELWQNVTANWNDEAAHAAFLSYCRAERRLGEAAARYREEFRRSQAYRDTAHRAEIAEKKLQGIILLATLELEATRGQTAARLQRARLRLPWTAALVFLICAAYLVLRSWGG